MTGMVFVLDKLDHFSAPRKGLCFRNYGFILIISIAAILKVPGCIPKALFLTKEPLF